MSGLLAMLGAAVIVAVIVTGFVLIARGDCVTDAQECFRQRAAERAGDDPAAILNAGELDDRIGGRRPFHTNGVTDA